MKDSVDLDSLASAKEVVEFDKDKEFKLKKDCIYRGEDCKAGDKVLVNQNQYDRLKKAGVL